MTFSERIKQVLESEPDKLAIEFDKAWLKWGDLHAYVNALNALLEQGGLRAGERVTLVARNRAAHAAALIGFVASQRSVAMIYGFQSPHAIARDISTLSPVALVADESDWTEDLIRVAAQAGTLGIALPRLLDTMPYVVSGLKAIGKHAVRSTIAEPQIALLSSGTTGTPKRLGLQMAILGRCVESMTLGGAKETGSSTDFVTSPIGGIGGVLQLFSAVYQAHRVCLMEKFVLHDWVDGIKRHQPATIVVVPAMVRAMLEMDVPKSDLQSVKLAFGGSAPLEPEIQDRFEAQYGIPILWGYGATEFAGTAASWTPALRQQFNGAKRGSVGRALPGITLRVVHPETGYELAHGEHGYVEAKIPALGDEWIHTTDIASMDDDGFVFLHGRGDGAINRGGFKVLPETIVNALRQHPSVLDAAAFGVPDGRLGEVPVAAVELKKNAEAVSSDSLAVFLRETLPSHSIPVRMEILAELPRTQSLKVSIAQLKELLASP